MGACYGFEKQNPLIDRSNRDALYDTLRNLDLLSSVSKDVINLIAEYTESIKVNQITKVLLVGPGSSGTSTMRKQLQMKCDGCMPEWDTDTFTPYVQQKMVHYMKILCNHSIDMDQYLQSELHDLILGISRISIPHSLTKPLADKIKLLWQDPVIQSIYELKDLYMFPTNAAYFLNKLNVISSDSYQISVED